MIFYFTGTGNSLYAAKKLLGDGEALISMASAADKKEYRYTAADGEKIGFIFPVYCFTLNDVVLDFVRHLELEGASYVYAVITCGGSIGNAGGFLRAELKKRGIHLDGVYPLLMPDNTVFFYDIAPENETRERLDRAESELEKIRGSIESRQITRAGWSIPSRAMRPVYHLIARTNSFHVTDKCVGCGMCARNCPDHAIEMKDKKPVWVKPRCTKCSACINRCPVQAIQYGRGTEKRLRYVNPYMK